MLTDISKKVKDFFRRYEKDLFLAAFIFVVSIASFGLGRLSIIWPVKEPIRIENQEFGIRNYEREAANNSPAATDSSFLLPDSAAGSYVASRSGSSYHLPTCPGAKQIKEENRIWFQTKAEAEQAGYQPAGNCPGL